MSTSDGVQKRNAFAACADLALPAFRGPLAVSCRIGSSVKRAWRLPRRTASNQPIADSGSVFGSKCDDNVGRFGFVRLQPVRIGVAPVGNVHHLGRLGTRGPGLGRLHDVEPVAVEEERVLPEQAVQLRNHWMVVRNGLASELGQSSFDLCGR